jgi:hypothetical protein
LAAALPPESELRRYWRVLNESEGNISEAARRLELPRETLKHRLKRAVELLGESVKTPHFHGRAAPLETKQFSVPKRGIARYIVTCAQNNTRVRKDTWKNLEALAEHYRARLLVSRFTYNVASYGESSVKPGKAPDASEYDHLWYDPCIIPHVCDDRVELAPGLVFCGELQIEPTAKRPISGFETYTGRKSCIIPHTTVSMESVASSKAEATKLIYSTGTVTLMNYIKKRAGLRAEHSHSYGGLLVEVDPQGRWFVRQLISGEKGEIQDLDVLVRDGKVTTNNRVEAITWGDIHSQRVDPSVAAICWAKGGMLDYLRPKTQFLHDILDFSRRSHHDRKDPFKMLKLRERERENVSEELDLTAERLKSMLRSETETVVVNSNHDRHLDRWLAEADWREDLPNAETILALALRKVRAINKGEENFNSLEAAMQERGLTDVNFLDVDESFVVCKDKGGGIECGMHGDLGPDGARGSPMALTRMGRRANTAHTHAAKIIDGLYVAGTSSLLDLEFNKGPSSWSQSHIVVYPNGTRAIVTLWAGEWRAR